MKLDTGHETRTTERAPGRAERRRGVTLGAVAGTLGLGCCVYPTVMALVGASSATAAAALGNELYDEWGWAFKGAAIAFAGGALLIQRRRAKECPVNDRPNVAKLAGWMVGTGVATYALLYAGTKALENLA